MNEVDCETHKSLKDFICDGCKGQLFMDDSGCYETCEGFRIAVAIEKLGLSEFWDGIGHYEARKDTAICEFLEKLVVEKQKRPLGTKELVEALREMETYRWLNENDHKTLQKAADLLSG